MKIYKYKLLSNSRTDYSGNVYVDVKMPLNARVLCVQTQQSEICVWAEVPDAIEAEFNRRFWIVGTGHRIPDSAVNYIGTTQLGSLVLHVYGGLQ